MTESATLKTQATRAALFGSAALGSGMPQPISRSPGLGTKPGRRGAAAARTAANQYTLQTGSVADLEQQVLAILAAGIAKNPSDLQSGDIAADGSVALDSMNAVFVLSIVKSVVGKKGWADLRKKGMCSAEDFRSAGALARLITRIRPTRMVAA